VSRRDRRCTQPAAAALDGRLPVIFLKDVSSKDYERLLSYMYHGEVSVLQAELLSLISAAKILGICGLAEETALDVISDDSDRISDRTVYLKDIRGVKREGGDRGSRVCCGKYKVLYQPLRGECQT